MFGSRHKSLNKNVLWMTWLGIVEDSTQWVLNVQWVWNDEKNIEFFSKDFS